MANNNRDIKFIKGGETLEFDEEGWAINPDGQTAIAFAGDYRNQVLMVSGTGTVIVYGSAQKTPPDFSQAPSIDNFYVPIVLADYAVKQTYYDGATGAVVAGGEKMVELNTNLLTWIGISRSAETVDVKFTETDNS